MRYHDLYRRSVQRLTDTSSSEPADHGYDVQLIMEAAFGLSRTDFWMNRDREIQDMTARRRFYRYLNRLLAHEPPGYILREKEFFSLPFSVGPGVLIPRPETEILVEKALPHLTATSIVLDIGCGCGNIAITLALHAGCTVVACDSSAAALRILRTNARRHGVEGRVRPVMHDLFPPRPMQFDLIVSNPPYLTEGEWRSLPPRIRLYEPKEALVSGRDGIEVLERIISAGRARLRPRGRLFLEIGHGQRDRIQALLATHGWGFCEFFDDYAGIPRIAGGTA